MRRDPFGLGTPAAVPQAQRPRQPEPSFTVDDAMEQREALALETPASAPVAQGRPAVARPSDGGEAQLREALSKASREVIEKIAWEVVPQLAETIIREELDRLIKEREAKGL